MFQVSMISFDRDPSPHAPRARVEVTVGTTTCKLSWYPLQLHPWVVNAHLIDGAAYAHLDSALFCFAHHLRKVDGIPHDTILLGIFSFLRAMEAHS